MTRRRMNKIISLLETSPFQDVKSEILDPKNRKALDALIALECVKPLTAWGGEIVDLTLQNKSVIYGLERSELWFNRIVSFLLGVATTATATALMHVLPL